VCSGQYVVYIGGRSGSREGRSSSVHKGKKVSPRSRAKRRRRKEIAPRQKKENG